MELEQHRLEAFAESLQRRDSPEVKNVVSLSKQKVEEAWTREPQQVAVEYAGETSEANCASEAISLLLHPLNPALAALEPGNAHYSPVPSNSLGRAVSPTFPPFVLPRS